jgi:aminopeptidase
LTVQPFCGIDIAMLQPYVDQATKNIQGILERAIEHTTHEQTLVLYDEETSLAKILVEAYRRVLPGAVFLHVQEGMADTILQKIFSLPPRSLVVLVQSTNFRLNEFRIRIELFKRELKTIEHVHLGRMPEDQYATYIDSLGYDTAYYRQTGKAVADILRRAKKFTVECPGTSLVYESAMEEPKLNIGDYRGMKNIGGTFPIGEVFTEPLDLTRVNGEAMVFAFAGNDHIVRKHEPFKIKIEQGLVTAEEGAPQEFCDILNMIKQEEAVTVREFGLGLNPAMGKHRMLNDITAFERMKGLHFSLGAKHSIYNKPGMGRKQGRYHVDVFIDVERILADHDLLFEKGEYAA